MVDTVTLNEALGAVPVPTTITTGASPVDADPFVLAYAITSGGTGDEVINLPMFDFIVGDYVNPLLIGRRITFYVSVLTDPGDSVVIAPDPSGDFYVLNNEMWRNHYKQQCEDVTLNFEGAVASFVWTGQRWHLDVGIADGNDDTTFTPREVRLFGLDGTLAAPGADVVLKPGAAGANATRGQLKFPTLPTADPNIADAIWNDSGTPKISAG